MLGTVLTDIIAKVKNQRGIIYDNIPFWHITFWNISYNLLPCDYEENNFY